MVQGIDSDIFRITPELAVQLEDDLRARSGGRWKVTYSEIQDDATNVYFVVELDTAVPEKILDDYKTIIKSVIGPRIPPRINGRWSWTVVIKLNGEIVDAVDALAYVYEQQGSQE